MSNYVFSTLAIPPFFTALCAFALGLWVFLRQPASQLRRVLLFGATCTGIWLASFGFICISADVSTAMLWARVAHAAVPFLPMCIYLYATVGLRQYHLDKALVWTSVAISLTFVGLAFGSHLLIASIEKYWWGYYPRYGPAGPFLVGYFVLALVLGVVKLRARLGSTTEGSAFSHRITMSLIAGFAVALCSVDFLAIFGVPVYPFGYAAVLVFLALILTLDLRQGIVFMTPGVTTDQILSTMQGALLVTSPQGDIEIGNGAAARLLGYSEVELVQSHLGSVFDSENECRRVLADCLTGQHFDELETVWRRSDGSAVEVSVSASAAAGSNGEPLGVVLAAMDLTRRRKMQKQLSERDEQLRQSQKMEAIGQLAGGIAHDFNNLLTAIIGNSSLALMTLPADDPHQPLVAEIQEVAERAAALTRQILAFSRRQMLRPEVISLNMVVLGMESLLRRTLGEDVDLRLHLAPDLRQSEIDPHQTEQMLLNLAVNARDAMPAGGALTVETANVSLGEKFCDRETIPGEYAMLAVTDTGHGMSPETRSHVFEPFFTTKGTGKGTGLGLSTVFGIVKQSGGSISVYSEPGNGATFKIYLPAVQHSPALSLTASSRQPEVPYSSGSILVVEDEAPVRRLIVRVLTRHGYRVEAAGSAQEAASIVEANQYRPDLLLTDVVLPGGENGREVADYMLALFPELPVIFMSGYTRDAVVHDGRINDNVAFLEKPFNPDALLRAVREALLSNVEIA